MGEALKVLLLACAGGALVSGSASCLLALLALAPFVALGACRGERPDCTGLEAWPACSSVRVRAMRSAEIGTTARRSKTAYRVR
jgi:hypothetical protein